jgi:hypothetical protein
MTRNSITKILLAAALLALTATSPRAHTSDNVRIVCHGLLSETNEVIADNDADYPTTCMFDDRVLKQVLGVCHVGEWCEVQGIGSSGNGDIFALSTHTNEKTGDHPLSHEVP